MIKVQKVVATVAGIGYLGKGGGTVAAAVYCMFWYLTSASELDIHWQLLITVAVIILGVWSGNAVDKIWGKDSNKVVIDEVAGMMITLLVIPHRLQYLVAALILFRFFDILKPLFIKRMEMLPKGWGVMGDDVLAGIYAQLLLQAIVFYQLF